MKVMIQKVRNGKPSQDFGIESKYEENRPANKSVSMSPERKNQANVKHMMITENSHYK